MTTTFTVTAPEPAQATAAQPATAAPEPARELPSLLTQPLGLEGWRELEPVVLASLAAREPLLLVGPHGTAKSFLIERLAEALQLEFRAYNASLISFDDLVGIPLPDDSGGLRYVGTPTSIWNAEVVFIDEINRTRPDLQNKVFPIVHERRVQGVTLVRLRHRRAAMNPPPAADAALEEDDAYLGAEPLDPALADRSTFLVRVPDWGDLSSAEQDRLLLDQFRGRREFLVPPPELVQRAERIYAALRDHAPERLAAHFRILADRLRKTRLSPRRVSALLRAALAIQAARCALVQAADPAASPERVDWETSCLLAALHAHPGTARSKALDTSEIHAAHRHAWTTSGLKQDDVWRELLGKSDPLERALLALRIGTALGGEDLSLLVLDGLASVEAPGLRAASSLAVYLHLEREPRVLATVIETLASDVQPIFVSPGRVALDAPFDRIQDVERLCGQLDARSPAAACARDTLARRLVEHLLATGFSEAAPGQVLARFPDLWRQLDLDSAPYARKGG